LFRNPLSITISSEATEISSAPCSPQRNNSVFSDVFSTSSPSHEHIESQCSPPHLESLSPLPFFISPTSIPVRSTSSCSQLSNTACADIDSSLSVEIPVQHISPLPSSSWGTEYYPPPSLPPLHYSDSLNLNDSAVVFDHTMFNERFKESPQTDFICGKNPLNFDDIEFGAELGFVC
jgi:hypothetical protein